MFLAGCLNKRLLANRRCKPLLSGGYCPECPASPVYSTASAVQITLDITDMQFTNEEKQMIAWLRKQHEGWRGVRMIILVASLICAAFAAWEIFQSGLGALPLLLILIAAYGTSYTLGSWAGRADISLLLKLVEDQERRRDV